MSLDESGAQQFLTFLVAGEEYAVGILEVREIIQLSQLTKMPSMPAWIRGVTNLRGKVVPVVDLALKVGLPETKLGERTCVVLVDADLDGERGPVGLLADSVSQVIDLSPSEIEPPPSFGTRIKVEYLRALARQDKKFALILDLASLLRVPLAPAEAVTPSPGGEAAPTTRPEPVVNA